MSHSLLYVALTGADNLTDPSELADIRKQHPSVEWAILLDPDKMGEARYPDETWMARFLKANEKGHKALHICGSAIHDFIAGKKEVTSLAEKFGRVQLNIWQKRDPVDARELDRVITAYRRPIILAMNKGNKELIDGITAPNMQILFDSSGGQGKSPNAWPTSLANRKCGYAGGLGEHNLKAQFEAIAKAANSRPFWIDMESSLRDAADTFSIEKARRILRLVDGMTVKR